MHRIFEYLFGRTLLHDLAGIHDRNTCRNAGYHAKVMRDQNQAHVIFSLQFLQQQQDLRLDRHIKGSGRLIGDDQLRFAQQCHRNHHALAKPT